MRRLISFLSKMLAYVCWDGLIAKIYGLCLGKQDLALCLHRVCETRRTTDPYPANTIEKAKLLHMLSLVSAFHRQGPSRLTLSFDDGYADAVEFVRTEAPRYPQIEWIVFICPIKSEKRIGFRWDRFELAQHGDQDAVLRRVKSQMDPGSFPPSIQGESLYQHINKGLDPGLDAIDPSLRIFPDLDPFRLSSLAELKALLEIPAVRLGNHSNTHLRLSTLSDSQANREIQDSLAAMQRLFAPTQDFAIPFGTPARDYLPPHIELLRRNGVRSIWTTYSAPFWPRESRAGAVLPRFVIIGTWSYKRILLYIALTSFAHRYRRSQPVTEYLALSGPASSSADPDKIRVDDERSA